MNNDIVHVVTYCTQSSFGSIMQTIGLKKTLLELGITSRLLVIEKEPAAMLPSVRLKLGAPKTAARQLGQLLVSKRLKKKYENTIVFIQNNVDVDCYKNYDEMKTAVAGEQLFLAGSDQIWNPRVLSKLFFLDFVPNGAKRLSYAASMGTTVIPEENRAEFARLVSAFDEISVREVDNKILIEKETDRVAEVHIDPVFLRPADEWRALSRDYPINEPYILVYALYWRTDINKEIKSLHLKTGKPIVVVADNYRRIYANRWIFDADSAQLLWLIDHADAVVTSSFHGTAFSIIFNKRFSAVINPDLPSRINCLMKLLEIENLPIGELSEEKRANEGTDAIIAEKRRKSIAYLRRILSGGD